MVRRVALRSLSCALPLLLGLLATSPPAAADRQSISFAWISQPALAVQTPSDYYAHNDAGNGVVVRRLSTGRHELRFWGLADATNGLGHAQVTAYGASSDICQIGAWEGDFVYVACFDAFGTPKDTPFTVMFIKTDYESREVAYLWADDPTNGSYTPDPAYLFNPAPGVFFDEAQIDRLDTGLYDIRFQDLDLLGENDGHVQVSAYGFTPAHCKLESSSGDSARVRCRNLAGTPVDSRFNLLFIKQEAARENLSYGWVDDAIASNGVMSPSSSTSPGGSISWQRTGTGEYGLVFTDLEDYGVDGGSIQVTAYGTDDAWCKIVSWNAPSANVRCWSSAGAPMDSRFMIHWHRTARRPFNQEYAFATSQIPTASHTPSGSHFYNRSGGGVSFTRAGTGQYTVHWPGMENVGSDGGAVMASIVSGPGHCKPELWSDTQAEIRCFDETGAAVDANHNALFWKPTEGSEGVAYAFADQPTTVSYQPNDHYSHNPAGGSIVIDRTGVGQYEVTWTGYGDTIQYLGGLTGHPQVSAYGPSSDYCNTGAMHVDGDTIEVHCFDASGSPTDTRFVALYLKADRTMRGVAYAWAHLSNVAEYDPLDAYSANSTWEPITLSRSGPGDYHYVFDDLGLSGLGDLFAHRQISTRGLTPVLCERYGMFLSDNESGGVRCSSSSGILTDATYDLLLLKPGLVPEPATATMLFAGCLLLVWLRHARHEA
jgi:hypothetical protein